MRWGATKTTCWVIEICKQIEGEGLVLLKNDNNALPLSKEEKVSCFLTGVPEKVLAHPLAEYEICIAYRVGGFDFLASTGKTAEVTG